MKKLHISFFTECFNSSELSLTLSRAYDTCLNEQDKTRLEITVSDVRYIFLMSFYGPVNYRSELINYINFQQAKKSEVDGEKR